MIGLKLFAILCVIVVTILLYCKRKLTFWKRKNVYAEPPLFLLGNSKDVILKKVCMGDEFKNVYSRFKKLGLEYGGYYSSLRPVLVPVDLDFIRTIMTKDFHHFTDHPTFIDEALEPLTGHLFNLRGSRWRHMRTKLTPTFTSGKMKMMFQTLVDSSVHLEKLLENLAENRESVFIKNVAASFTTDIIMSCAFGIEANCLKESNTEFQRYGSMVFDTSFRGALVRFISLTYPQLFSWFQINPLRKEMRDFFKNLVRSVVEHREKNNIIRRDFIHLLIQLKNNVNVDQHEIGDLKHIGREEKALTLDELTAQAFVFWIAGFETSSTTTTFCMYEMTQNLHVQEKLRKEILGVLEKYEGKITYAAMQEMTYMDMCINETLRKYPPVPILARLCTERYEIPNSKTIIEKGDVLFIPIFGIHTDPDIYPDPEKFDPERFSQQNVSQRHPSAWMPFGDGPRQCIGLRFGMMQTKMALITMLRHFKFTLNSKTKSPLRFDPGSFILTAEGNVWLNIEKL